MRWLSQGSPAGAGREARPGERQRCPACSFEPSGASDGGLFWRRRRRVLRFTGRSTRCGARRLLPKGIELGLGFRNLALHRVDGRVDAALEAPRGVLDRALELTQLVQLDLAVDVGLDVVDVALQTAEQMA